MKKNRFHAPYFGAGCPVQRFRFWTTLHRILVLTAPYSGAAIAFFELGLHRIVVTFINLPSNSLFLAGWGATVN